MGGRDEFVANAAMRIARVAYTVSFQVAACSARNFQGALQTGRARPLDAGHAPSPASPASRCQRRACASSFERDEPANSNGMANHNSAECRAADRVRHSHPNSNASGLPAPVEWN